MFFRWDAVVLAVAVWVVGCEGATEPPGRPGGQITVGQITKESGEDQSGAAGAVLPEPLVVRLFDTAGNPIVGTRVTFTVVAGGGSIEKGSVVTGPDGVASSGAWTLGPSVGVQQVRSESDAAEVVFSARAYAPPTDLTGRLAFVSERDGNPEIYAIGADGSGLQRLTTHGGLDASPNWSPDGGRIAFVSDRDGTPTIHVMRADGSHVIRRTAGLSTVTGYSGAHEPAWSPDGSTIAFSTQHDGSAAIVTVDDTDETVTLLFDYPGYDGQPSWSPDGRRLAFVSDYEAYDFVLNIYTINADGTGVQLRTQGFGLPPDLPYYLHPAWSPDGGMIAFVYGRLMNASPGREGELTEQDVRFTVAVMSADGVFLRDLAWAGDIPWVEALDPGSLTWSSDGRGIAYTFIDCNLLLRTRCTKERSVNYVSLDGTQGGTIVANAYSPAWRP